MKRKMITLFLTTVAVVVLTPSMSARPTHSETRFYYQYNYPSPINPSYPIGEYYQSCAGGFPYQEGEVTDIHVSWFEPCPWTIDPFPSCEEVGLYSTGCEGYCVMYSYLIFSQGDPCIN